LVSKGNVLEFDSGLGPGSSDGGSMANAPRPSGRRLSLLLLALAAAACGDTTPGPDAPVESGSESETFGTPRPGTPGGPPGAGQGGTAAVADSLSIERDTHDFGDVFPRAAEHTVFPIRIVGEDDVVVEELRHSCDCTAATLHVVEGEGAGGEAELGRPYAPGTVLELRGTLNTVGNLGEQRQGLHVVFEGGHIVTFLMTATITPFLDVDPPRTLEMQNVDALAGDRAQATLRTRDGAPVALSIAEAARCEGVELELVAVEPDADGRAPEWSLVARIEPGVEVGTRRCRLRIATDVHNPEAQPRQGEELDEAALADAVHEVDYGILIQVDPLVISWPAELDLGRLDAVEGRTEEVRLSSRDGDYLWGELEVSVAPHGRPDAPFEGARRAEARFRRTPDGGEVQLEIGGFERTGPFRGSIVVELGHPQQERLIIPFRGIAAAP